MRRVRAVAFAAFAGLLLMCVATPRSATSAAAAAAAPTEFVELQGEGAWSVTQEMVPWENELGTASSYINLNYISRGSLLARDDLIGKTVDYAISGLPFTKDQLGKVQGGASAFISAPVAVASFAVFVEPTKSLLSGVPQFVVDTQICDPGDPSTWPPDVHEGQGCFVDHAYEGPVRIPNRNLAAMFLATSDGSIPALDEWNNPHILEAFGLNPDAEKFKNILGQDSLGPAFAGRSDPDEISFYMQKFSAAAAPDLWHDIAPARGWIPIKELMPGQPGIQRDGAEQQLELLAQSGCGVGISQCLGQGAIAPAPASMLQSWNSFINSAPAGYPPQTIAVAEMQNKHGDWVAPTPDSLTKAVEAGGEAPLYALTHDTPDAYPLVWVDRLYAPAKGLSVEKTEGLAMLIRYLATTGQDKAAPVGEGHLTPPLVTEALTAADALVTSNCTAAGGVVVKSDDPGPLAPPSASAMSSVGPMLHCEHPSPPPPTTTTVAPATTVPFVPSGNFNDNGGSFSSSGDNSGATTGGGSSSTPTTSSAGASPQQAATATTVPPATKHGPSPLLVADNLPLPLPAGATGTDRLATFLLGAALYLILRKPVGRMITRMRA